MQISYAQFSTGGTGQYQRQIYWLPWHFSTGNSLGLVSIVPASNTNITYTPTNLPSSIVMNGTYTWNLSAVMRIVGKITNLSGSLTTNKINSYGVSGLQRMYTGFAERQMCLTTPDNSTISFDIQLDFQIFKNNAWEIIDPVHHGLVFADSESMDGAEYISSLVNANSNWYIIDKPALTNTNSNVWTTGYTIRSKDTVISSTNYKFVHILNTNATQQGATTVMYGKGVNSFKSLTMKGSGISHIMLGYFINHDPSNATGYANAMHFQEIVRSNSGGTFLTIQDTILFKNIANISIPGADLTTDTYFGNPPNVNAPYSDSLSNLDALSPVGSYYKGHNTDTVKFSILASNKFNTPAYVYVFLDLNKDKLFSASEAFPVMTIPANTVDTNLMINWTNVNFVVGDYIVRFRITTDSLLDFVNTANVDERSTGLARNGEVTDRVLTIQPIEALPLNLVGFKAAQQADNIVVQWETADERDMFDFELEYANNAKDWTKIAVVPAKNQFNNSYQFTHKHVSGPQHFYRLKMNEVTGISYSRIIALYGSVMSSGITIAPNPTTGILNILDIEQATVAILYNALGELIETYSLSAHQHSISLQNKPAGIYLLKINNQVFKVEKL